MKHEQRWALMISVCQSIFEITNKGGCVFFYVAWENTKFVLKNLNESGLVFQILIIQKELLLYL